MNTASTVRAWSPQSKHKASTGREHSKHSEQGESTVSTMSIASTVRARSPHGYAGVLSHERDGIPSRGHDGVPLLVSGVGARLHARGVGVLF